MPLCGEHLATLRGGRVVQFASAPRHIASAGSRSGLARWSRTACRSTPAAADASASTSTTNGSTIVTLVGAAEPQAKVRWNSSPVGCNNGERERPTVLDSEVVDPAVAG